MGWLFYTDPSRVQGYAGEKDEITRLCTHTTDQSQYRPLQISKVGSTWYAAIQHTPINGEVSNQTAYETTDDGSYVFAAVFLTKYHDGCFGYKDMDETMGPCEARAPLTLINKLSKIIDPESYAHNWRKRCETFAKIPNYAVGDVITLGTPISLNNGSEIKTVKKGSYFHRGKTRYFYVDVDTGERWRLKRAYFEGSSLQTSEIAHATDIMAEFAKRQAVAAQHG